MTLSRRSFVGVGAAVLLVGSLPLMAQAADEGAPGTVRSVTFATHATTTPNIAPDEPGSGGAAGGGEERYDDESRLPPIPENPDVPRGTPAGGAVSLGSSGAQGSGASIVFRATTSTLEPRGTAKIRPLAIPEPQVATDGTRVLETWNRGAARSWDSGATWTYLDPFASYTDDDPRTNDEFCCDQLVMHLPGPGKWVWFRQGATDEHGNNSNILATADDAGFDAAELTTNDFVFTAQDFGLPDHYNLDSPRMGWDDRFVYLTTNIFDSTLDPDGGVFKAGLALRISIDSLSGAPAVQFLTTLDSPDLLDANATPLGSLAPVAGPGDTGYIASIYDDSRLTVISWPDEGNTFSVDPGPFRDPKGALISFPIAYDGGATCASTVNVTPNEDWCLGLDSRLNTGWRRGSFIGWAWTVRQDTELDRPYPYVWLAEFDPGALATCQDASCNVRSLSLWSSDSAFAFPALTVDSLGDLGGVVMFGGGDWLPGCAAVLLPAAQQGDPQFLLAGLPQATSDAGDSLKRSGDYLGATVEPDGTTFAGACYTYHPEGQVSVHLTRFAAGAGE